MSHATRDEAYAGGRASTRRQNGKQFDHGCSFIAPIRDKRVQTVVEALKREGVYLDHLSDDLV